MVFIFSFYFLVTIFWVLIKILINHYPSPIGKTDIRELESIMNQVLNWMNSSVWAFFWTIANLVNTSLTITLFSNNFKTEKSVKTLLYVNFSSYLFFLAIVYAYLLHISLPANIYVIYPIAVLTLSYYVLYNVIAFLALLLKKLAKG